MRVQNNNSNNAAPPTPAPAPSAPAYTAADFPDGVTTFRLHMVTIMLADAANPPDAAPIWPAFLGDRPWVGRMAWLAALTECVAGACVLIGLLTRFSALTLAGVMGVVMWLTAIGPVVLQGAPSTLGFLPQIVFTGEEAMASFMKWKDLLWQFALFMIALAVAIGGSGPAALDRLIFGSSRPTDANARRKHDDE